MKSGFLVLKVHYIYMVNEIACTRKRKTENECDEERKKKSQDWVKGIEDYVKIRMMMIIISYTNYIRIC